MYKDRFISAIITAAGNGSRMKSDIPKLELPIGDKKIIEITISNILKVNIFDEIIIATSENLFEIYKKRFESFKNIKIVLGGKTREESTFNAIKNLSENSEITLCHDGARPFVTEEIILNSIDSAIENSAAITVVPVKDTIKKIACEIVDSTPKRKDLYAVQTPQTFKTKVLKSAYEKFFDKILTTDDSRFVEELNVKVHTVLGSYENFKITTVEDYELAKIIWRKYENRNRI